MVTRSKAVIGGALIGLAILTLTAGTLVAQEPTAMAGDPQMAGPMEQMMEQCAQMMQMMSIMWEQGTGSMPATPMPGQ